MRSRVERQLSRSTSLEAGWPMISNSPSVALNFRVARDTYFFEVLNFRVARDTYFLWALRLLPVFNRIRVMGDTETSNR